MRGMVRVTALMAFSEGNCWIAKPKLGELLFREKFSNITRFREKLLIL